MNRQVPQKQALIIGRGRLARHLAHYFDLSNISYFLWSRSDSIESLQFFRSHSQWVLLAISDNAIVPFCEQHQLLPQYTIHFSGSLSTDSALQLHPLMTFNQDLYDLKTYQSFAFVSSSQTPAITDLFPQLPNIHYRLPQGSEGLYHALCVLSGNGTSLLWQAVAVAFENQLKIPSSVLWPYLQRIVANLQNDYQNSLTGPWVRNDLQTIQKNRTSLHGSALLDLYESFYKNYQMILETKKQSDLANLRSLQ